MRYIDMDMESWPRRKHFDFFTAFDYPHFSLCANVDVTALYPEVKSRGLSFTATVAHLLACAANRVPEFRQRIRAGRVVEHDVVHPSFTVLTADEVFSFCFVPFGDDFGAFHARAVETIARVKAHLILEDEPGRDDMLFMSGIPWVAFTSLTHPIHMHPVDSVPRLSWGRFFSEGERMKMPISIQAHHALVDGLHVGRFFDALQARLDDPTAFLGRGGERP